MNKVKRINEDSNAYYVMYPLYVVSKLTGTAPYSYKRIKTVLRWKVTRFGIIQTVLYIFLSVSTLVPAFQYQVRNLKKEQSDLISIYSDIFRAGNGVIIAIAKLLTSILYRNHYCSFMDKLVEFDKDISRLGVPVDNKTIFKNILRITILICIIILVITGVDFALFTLYSDLLTHLYWICCLSSFCITTVGTLQFLCFIYIVYKRFVSLNQYISTLTNEAVEFKTKSMNNVFKRNINKVIDISIIGKQIKQINVLTHDHQINILSEMHDNLCSLSQTVNSMYSLHILLLTSTTFVVLVTQLYFFYLMLSANDNYQLTLSKLWTAVIWGVVFFSMLYFITLACSKIKEEADSSSALLHKMNVDDDDTPTRSSVEMFSLQMLHQKVEFTACGFFPVDFSVLYMIIGAVTTYLVFLIQFEMASRTANQKKT